MFFVVPSVVVRQRRAVLLTSCLVVRPALAIFVALPPPYPFGRLEVLLQSIQSLLLNIVQFDILSKDDPRTDQFAPRITIGIHPPPSIDRVKVRIIDESVAILIFFPVKGFVSTEVDWRRERAVFVDVAKREGTGDDCVRCFEIALEKEEGEM